jgi:hypothetical protein
MNSRSFDYNFYKSMNRHLQVTWSSVIHKCCTFMHCYNTFYPLYAYFLFIHGIGTIILLENRLFIHIGP